MVDSKLDDKRIFLIVTEDKKKMSSIVKSIRTQISKPTIFEAVDMTEAVFKFQNAVPHVIILDLEVAKASGAQFISDRLEGEEDNNFSVIFTADFPDNELFIDQMVSGQVQILTNYEDQGFFTQCLAKALNRLNGDKKAEFALHFLAPNEMLFKEGVPGLSAFLVKRGELMASKVNNGQRIVLGKILAGEFVGEMAHINQEPRSATVTAVTDCELIEIPFGSLDPILFSKPSWSKALFLTLSKRLKMTNEKLSA